MISNERNRRQPKHMWTVIGFGVLALVQALLVEVVLTQLFRLPNIDAISNTSSVRTVIAIALMAGIVEEAAKFLPFAWYVGKKAFFNQVADGVIFFSTIGLVFGIVENIFYQIEGGVSIGVYRLVVGLFFHGALSGTVGFAFAKSHVLGQSMNKVWLTLITIMGVHTLYDFFLLSQNYLAIFSLLITIFMNCYLFWLYYKATTIDQRVLNGLLKSPLYVPAASLSTTESSSTPLPSTKETPSQGHNEDL